MKNKLLRNVLLVSFLMVIITACGQTKESVDKSKTDNNSLTVGILQDPNVKDFKTNEYTKWLEEKTGIDINFKMFPNKQGPEKLSIMINSNEQLPEVLIGFRLSTLDVARYGKQGYLLPLNDYYENNSIHIKKFYDEHTDLYKYFKSPDGNIYTVPQYTESLGNMFPLRAWINQKWLDELKLDMPTTTEELKNVLQQFKDKDPNNNNTPDEIPMIGSQNAWFGYAQSWLMNAFIYDDTKDKLIVKDGKIEPIYNKEEYKQGLIYMNELCEKGLLSPLTFTQDKAQYTQLLVSGGDKNVVGVWICGGTLFPKNDKKMADYKPLPPIKGPNGLRVTTYKPSIPFPMAFLTKDCKQPEVAFEFLDIMYSEEAAMRARYGIEGKDWVKKESGEKGRYEDFIGLEGKFKCINVPWSEAIQNTLWKNTGLQCRTSEIADALVLDGNPLDSEHLISSHVPVNYKYKPDEKTIVPLVLYNQEEVDELGDIKTTIIEYVNESTARFITGNMNIGKQWGQYVKELDKIGIDKYISLTQKAWERMQ